MGSVNSVAENSVTLFQTTGHFSYPREMVDKMSTDG